MFHLAAHTFIRTCVAALCRGALFLSLVLVWTPLLTKKNPDITTVINYIVTLTLITYWWWAILA
jgi:hypothetical protein